MSVLYLDCETTGLDPRQHVPWEVAIVEPDGAEHVWCWRPSDLFMEDADSNALAIGRIRHRAPLIYDGAYEEQAATEIHALLQGNVVVGSNPHFDVNMLTAWLDYHHLDWPAHYRPVCAVTMAAGTIYAAQRLDGRQYGAVEDVPWRSYEVSRACGIEPPTPGEAHTALGDALWIKRLYERITGTA